MAKLIRFALVAVLLSCSSVSFAQLSLSSKSNIQIGNLKVFCKGSLTEKIPFLQADILINADDSGLPGLLYLGTINDGQSQAYFLGANGWTLYNGGSLPPYAILRQGLQNSTITLDLTTLPSSVEQNIYLGYGALTAQSEKLVQAGIAAVAKIKEKLPDRKIESVDPDLHRLALVQENMTKNTKYQFVLKSADFPNCSTN